MKIYVASSWRNTYYPRVLKKLRESGLECYDFRNPNDNDKGFSWADISPNWHDWEPSAWRAALDHDIAEKGFNNDFTAMQNADICVLVMPSGRSAHIEAGWFAGQGKKVYALVQEKAEPDLMYKIFTGGFATSIGGLINLIIHDQLYSGGSYNKKSNIL